MFASLVGVVMGQAVLGFPLRVLRALWSRRFVVLAGLIW